MNKLCILLSAAALVVSAAAAVPAGAQTALPTPDPQTVWAFFEALPDADLPAGINTRAERVQFVPLRPAVAGLRSRITRNFSFSQIVLLGISPFAILQKIQLLSFKAPPP